MYYTFVIYLYFTLVASRPDHLLRSVAEDIANQVDVRRQLQETNSPTINPTTNPTFNPSESPTNGPTFNPTTNPTGNPTSRPSSNPTATPSSSPTANPSEIPTQNPSETPTQNPVTTAQPTTSFPSVHPTSAPSSNSTAPTGDAKVIHEQVWTELNEINQDILAATMFLAAVPLTFFGGKWFNWIVFFIGFCVTGYGVFSLCDIVLELESDLCLYTSLGVGLLGGGILSYAHKLSIFSIGAVAGSVFFQFVYIHIETYTKFQPEYYQYVIIVCAWALLCGYIVYKAYEFLLRGITAFLGGFMFASAISYLVKRVSEEDGGVLDVVEYFDYKDTTCDNYWCYLLAASWLTMFLAGAFKQYGLRQKYRKCCGKKKRKTAREDEVQVNHVQLVVSSHGAPLLGKQSTNRSKRGPHAGGPDREMIL